MGSVSDPSEVDQGLHVGLHSMRTRIARIGGEFHIDSKPGHTRIKVILPMLDDQAENKTLI